MSRNELLADAIVAASRNVKATRHEALSAFLGLEGSQYDGELMVVGRAVNGWSEFVPAEAVDRGRALEIARAAKQNNGKCALEWVHEMWGAADGYDTGRSAFWRTVRQVQAALVPESADDAKWSSRLAWSNLSKLSDREGNPPEWLWNSQVDACRKIIRSEISEFRPKRILFSTGWDWAKWFLEELAQPEATRMTGSRMCEAYGRLSPEAGSVAFVVASHPQGKPEAEWVAEVLDGFRRADTM